MGKNNTNLVINEIKRDRKDVPNNWPDNISETNDNIKKAMNQNTEIKGSKACKARCTHRIKGVYDHERYQNPLHIHTNNLSIESEWKFRVIIIDGNNETVTEIF